MQRSVERDLKFNRRMQEVMAALRADDWQAAALVVNQVPNGEIRDFTLYLAINVTEAVDRLIELVSAQSVN